MKKSTEIIPLMSLSCSHTSCSVSFTSPSLHIRLQSWTAEQLREAFRWDSAPRYLLRNRDRIFGHDFVEQAKAMGIKQVLSAPCSPWQRAYVERVIGTICRECLDHMVVLNDSSLSRHLQAFVGYYHRTRTQLSLQNDAPDPRSVQLPDAGRSISIPEVGGLQRPEYDFDDSTASSAIQSIPYWGCAQALGRPSFAGCANPLGIRTLKKPGRRGCRNLVGTRLAPI